MLSGSRPRGSSSAPVSGKTGMTGGESLGSRPRSLAHPARLVTRQENSSEDSRRRPLRVSASVGPQASKNLRAACARRRSFHSRSRLNDCQAARRSRLPARRSASKCRWRDRSAPRGRPGSAPAGRAACRPRSPTFRACSASSRRGARAGDLGVAWRSPSARGRDAACASASSPRAIMQPAPARRAPRRCAGSRCRICGVESRRRWRDRPPACASLAIGQRLLDRRGPPLPPPRRWTNCLTWLSGKAPMKPSTGRPSLKAIDGRDRLDAHLLRDLRVLVDIELDQLRPRRWRRGRSFRGSARAACTGRTRAPRNRRSPARRTSRRRPRP